MKEGMNNRIRKLLQERGMTQKELATKANITEAAVSHYIKGDRIPRAAVVDRIASALGTSVDYLLNGSLTENTDEKEVTFRLIARNASTMTTEEKMEILNLLFKTED